MHVPLRYSVGGMPKQTRDRKFGKAKVAGNASKGVTEHMWSHTLEFCLTANAVENTDDSNEMPVSPIGRKEKRGTRPTRSGINAVHCSVSKNPDLGATLGVGKAHAVVAAAVPVSL